MLKENNHELDVANLVNGYSKNENGTYNLSLSLYELTGNSDLQNLYVTLSTQEVDGKSYLCGINVLMAVDLSAITIDLKTDDTRLNNIGQVIDLTELYNYIKSYSYGIDEEWEARESDWEKAADKTYSLTIGQNNGVADQIYTLKQKDNLPLPLYTCYFCKYLVKYLVVLP